MRHLIRNSIFAIGIVLLAVWAIVPPEKQLRLGKDLRGGTTLVYAVDTGQAEDPAEVLGKTITVLKDRVDPSGVLEIQFVAQGRDRLEITMPLPDAEVQGLRAAYSAALAKLAQSTIDADEVERAMRAEGAARDEAIASLAAGNAEAARRLADAAAKYDAARVIRGEYDRLQGDGSNASETLDLVAAAVAQAELEYEAARDGALRSGLDPDRLDQALRSSTDRKLVEDSEAAAAGGEKFVELPSAQQRALDQIRAEHPDLSAEIDAAIAAFNTYIENREGLDDPEELKRLVQSAGVPAFRITVDPQGSGTGNTHPDEARLRAELAEKGPANVRIADARWCRINNIEQWFNTVQDFGALQAVPQAYFAQRGYVVEPYQGEFWMLCWDVRGKRLTQEDGAWSVKRAFQTSDEVGRPAIGFEMDPRGAVKLRDLTTPNVGNSMAILLDEQVYSAPNLNNAIGSNGIIQGGQDGFRQSEIDYIVRVLTAGSLRARLSAEPISQNTIAPEFGQDNLDAGFKAGVVALIAVSGFMIFYYFAYGLVSVLGLLCTALLIVAAMALARAPFTLPGIAGIILTFGMAVDANVLIYERVREELLRGENVKRAVQLGYSKAMSSIVDGNVTNLIVCFVLANPALGTQEIRGFAVTLGIGVVCTMFSALFISRVLLALLTDTLKVRKMGMLPMALPVIDRVLSPKINWMNLRWLFVVMSTAYMGVGIGMVAWQGEKILDAEFRGGTQVDFRLREARADEAGIKGSDKYITMTRADVEEAVRGVGREAAEGDPLRPLRDAEIIAVNPEPGGVRSDRFVVKTYATNQELVIESIVRVLGDRLESRAALAFRGSNIDTPTAADGLAFPVLSGVLGEAIGRPEVRNDVTGYIGGAALLLEGLEPAPSREQIVDRLTLTRGASRVEGVAAREFDVVVLEGTREAVTTAAVLVRDPGLSYFDDAGRWNDRLAKVEWGMVVEALSRAGVRASVQSFSPAVAQGFQQQAAVSVFMSFLLILIYIWVRFGSARYSIAAVACLVHDCLTVVGLIAVAEILYENPVTEPFARALGIEPFKIDMNLVAALLTIIGYSLNDTIIVMDRIRETRGKLSYATKEVINESINSTISRTVITSGTTLLATLVLYVLGGSGVRAFSFALTAGILVGTYSSIAVAAPLVWSEGGKKAKAAAAALSARLGPGEGGSPRLPGG